MKNILKFSTFKSFLPRDYRSIIVSFIKKSLTECESSKYYDKFYENNTTKDFTWSLNAKNIVFKNNVMEFDDNVFYVEFSVSDVGRQGMIITMALMGQKGKLFNLPDGNAMMLENITQIKQQSINSNNVIFKTVRGSGLIVREHNKETNKDIYYSCENKDFDKHLKKTIKYQLENAGFSKIECDKLKIYFQNGKKIVVKHYGVYIDISIGTINIEADSRILEYLYMVGIGGRRSIGFGMVDIC